MKLLHFYSNDEIKLGIKTEEGIIGIENTVIVIIENIGTLTNTLF